MGRILVAGEPGNQIIAELAPRAGRDRDRQAGQGRVLRHRRCTSCCRQRGITHLVFMGVTTEVCVQTSMREANDRGYDCLLLEDCTESYFPQFKAAARRDDPRPGRHRRLDRDQRAAAGRARPCSAQR